MEKKILFLGGAHHQCPIIKKANDLKFNTICVDNIPNNPGHKIAHKSKIISTIDKNKILEYAYKEKIDSVICYGTDIALETQSYICDNLKLPGPKIETVNILTKKNNFRFFLNNFKIQHSDYLVIKNKLNTNHKKEVNKLLKKYNNGLYVKPIDSSGSKGVSQFKKIVELEDCIKFAFKYSKSKNIIIENSIKSIRPQLCGDGFIMNKKIIFVGFGNGCFYDKVNAPYAEYFPSSYIDTYLNSAISKMEKIFSKAKYENGPFNLDIIFDLNDEPIVIELTPRAGGNFLPQAIKHSYGVDLDLLILKYSLNEVIENIDYAVTKNEFIYNYMVHSKVRTIYNGKTKFPNEFSKPFKVDIFIKNGQSVDSFSHGGNSVGNIMWKINNFKLIFKLDRLIKNNPLFQI